MSNQQYVNTSLSLPEVFAKVAALPTLEEKVALLYTYDNQVMQWFVDVMYNAPLGDIEIPKFIKSPYPLGNNNMSIQSSRSKIETVIADKDSPSSQRTLRMVLESVHANEADLIVNLLEGKKIPGISKGVWKRIYPAFFQGTNPESLENILEED